MRGSCDTALFLHESINITIIIHTNRILSTITRTPITTYSDVGLSQEQSSFEVFDSVVITGVDDVDEGVGRSSETARRIIY